MPRIPLSKKTQIALTFLRIYIITLVVLIFVKFFRAF
jgi:hypothetical protein